MTKSSHKRLLAALAGETLERPPIWLMRQAGRYLAEYRATRAKAGSFLDLCYAPELAAEVTLQPIRRYGFDASILFADILLLPNAMGQKLDYREGEGPVLEPVRSVAALQALGEPDIHATLAPVYETVKLLAQKLPAECTLIGFAGAPWTVATYMVEGRGGNDQTAAKTWAYGDPDGFQVLIDRLVVATIDYLGRQIEAGAEVVQLFDTWAGALPEVDFQRWCVAPVKKIAAALKAKYPAVPIIAFPRNAGANYPQFIGMVDGLSLDTSVPVGRARETLQDKIAVQGNLDPRYVVVGGEAMRRETDRLLTALGHGPYIFNLGHGIVPETPPEHVGALVQQVQGWRR
jgi:uroporphyrinogen decarboxylase